VECILGIPLHEGMDDLVAWHFNTNRQFSVRSAYKVFREDKKRSIAGVMILFGSRCQI
jgi:hypothetical protein